ncbi:Ycf66 family protein [Chlorogloeopsis sp. ULAP01]|uniref:Ycf66 family protein n=1 Tax=Chlorogloeopsis sp. ULAP01 TaxID=3056483 RepID=UPI0025AB566B|nr:Ycf66 family protein [Chlorogloeopsis sp. ULAP01]MDM9382441.1 Ycf66 family protein [Chlorogloeopsis sp. ULAP01]
MLAYILALVVGLGSIAIYMAAFFFPEIHRKNDFIWSGVGLFYALMLWVFAPRLSGWLLLGHLASVALLVWFGWQTLSLRRQLTPKVQQTPVPTTQEVQTTIEEQVSKLSSLQERLGQVQNSLSGVISGLQGRFQKTTTKKAPETPTIKEAIAQTTETPAVEVIDNRTSTTEPLAEAIAPTETEATIETVPEAIPPHPPSPELVEAAQEAAAEAQAVVENLEKIPVEEIAPDAELAPPAEAPPEQIPPSDRAG